jgi:NAD(P)-dependent dehydrogenase (short-subunit alcohol dehydrogenase family)
LIFSRFWIVSHEGCANNHPLRVGAACTVTVESFDRLMAVNARGTMLCYKHAAKQMIAQGCGGRIIGANCFYLFFWHVLI